MDEIHGKLQHISPALVNRKGPILLPGSAQSYVAEPSQKKVNELDYHTLLHPPNLLELSETDCRYLNHLHQFSQEKIFNKSVLQDFIDSRTLELFFTGKHRLGFRWTKCVRCNGPHFD